MNYGDYKYDFIPPAHMKESEYQWKVEILKDLPSGSIVTYRGTSHSLHGMHFIKVSDGSKKMKVLMGGTPFGSHYDLSYEWLTCKEIQFANDVLNRLVPEVPF